MVKVFLPFHPGELTVVDDQLATCTVKDRVFEAFEHIRRCAGRAYRLQIIEGSLSALKQFYWGRLGYPLNRIPLCK